MQMTMSNNFENLSGFFFFFDHLIYDADYTLYSIHNRSIDGISKKIARIT